jgi:ABC-type lipoprotein export system ATPase subunit
MIKLTNISKEYKHKKSTQMALNKINLILPRTGLISIIGESGSGKTSLINIIGKLDKPTSGQYYSEIHGVSRKDTFGYVFQNGQLVENLTVEENMLLMMEISNKKKNVEEVIKLLEVVNMINYSHRKISSLSRGQKQRIAIARSLINSPLILLVDEPTSNLDRQNSLIVMDILKSISQKSLVIVVIHDKKLAFKYSDQIIRLNRGEIVETEVEKSQSETDDQIDTSDTLKHEIIVDSEELFLTLTNVDKHKVKLHFDVQNENLIVYSDKHVISKKYIDTEEKSDFFVSESNQNQAQFRSNIEISKKTKHSIKYPIKLFGTLVLIILSILMALIASVYTKNNSIDPAEYQISSVNAVGVYSNNLDEDLYIYDQEINIRYVLPYNHENNYTLSLKTLYQFNEYDPFEVNFFIKPLALESINESMIIFGRYPNNAFEVVIDKTLFDKNSNVDIYYRYGIVNVESLLNSEITLNNGLKVKVVGVVDTRTPTFYIDLGILYAESVSNMEDYFIIPQSKATFTQTSISLEDNNEIYVSKAIYDEMTNLNQVMQIDIDNSTYYIKGYFENLDDQFNHALILKDEEIKELVYKQLNENNYVEMILTNKEIVLSMHPDFIDLIQVEEMSYLHENSVAINAMIFVLVSLMIAVFILLYQNVRLSFLTHKEVLGMKVLLGVNKLMVAFDYFKLQLKHIVLSITIPYIISGIIIRYLSTNIYIQNTFLGYSFINLLYGLLLLLLIQIIMIMFFILYNLRGNPIDVIKRINIS